MTSLATLSEIRRYPVKSMQGESLETAELNSLGIHGDRLWAVRDVESGKILSAKNPKVGQALLTCSAQTVIHHGQSTVVLTINNHQWDALDPAVHAGLGTLLGREVRLVPATGSDEVYESYWPAIDDMVLSDMTIDLGISSGTRKGTFVDLSALHLLTQNSVDHLRELNPELEVSLDRFRPGLAFQVEGASQSSEASQSNGTGFLEKSWINRTAHLGGTTLAIGSESPRCVMTTVAQNDLPRQLAVLQTIAQHNKVNWGGFGNFACLGVYAEVSTGGQISIGDTLALRDI
jgi:uncharacterized protein